MPIGLLSIASNLKKAGFVAELIDGQVDPGYLDLLAQKIMAPDLLWVGISSMTSGLDVAKAASVLIRNKRPDIKIVWGGFHATLFPESVVKSGYADAAVVGDGEIPAVSISQKFSQGANDLKEIPQVIFMDDQKVIHSTEQTEFMDVNTTPRIDYSFIDPDKYLYRDASEFVPGMTLGKVWVVNTGRGCPYKCTFCINNHSSQKWRSKDTEVMIDEFQEIIDKFDPEVIHIQDDLFFANKQRFRAFCDEYDKRAWKFKFFTLAFANYFNDGFINREALKWLEGKAVWLGIGVESGSERVRKNLKKPVTNAQVVSAVTMLKDFNIKIGLAFMTGLPIESREDRFETLRFIDQLDKINPNCTFALQAWRPIPGGELYELAKECGFDEPKTIDEWIKALAPGQGYYDPMKLPWNNPNEIMFLLALSASIGSKHRNLLRKFTYIVLRSFFALREAININLPFFEGAVVRMAIPIARYLGLISKI